MNRKRMLKNKIEMKLKSIIIKIFELMGVCCSDNERQTKRLALK